MSKALSKTMAGGFYRECSCGAVVGVDAKGKKWATTDVNGMLVYGDRPHVHVVREPEFGHE